MEGSKLPIHYWVITLGVNFVRKELQNKRNSKSFQN